MSAGPTLAGAVLARSQLERDAFERCRRITRRRARNFYYGLKLSPEPERSALYAVYAWMRCADDAVDAVEAGAAGLTAIEQRIAELRRATDAALAGRAPAGDTFWVALAATVARFDLRPEPFHAMLDGQLRDARRSRYVCFDDLRQYCYEVASTVGLLCIEIWGCRDESARALAIDRGIAFQLTNIIRDFRQDYDAGRVYVPLEDFVAHGLAPEDVRRWSPPGRCHDLVLEQIARAEDYYDRSAALDELIDRRFRSTAWAMTEIYRGLLEKMKRQPERIVRRRRVRLSALQKGMIAARARFGAVSAGAHPNLGPQPKGEGDAARGAARAAAASSGARNGST